MDIDPAARHLRLLFAQEFAARGFYPEAEAMLAAADAAGLNRRELELLARVAALNGDWSTAGQRFALLAGRCPEGGERAHFEKLASHAGTKRNRLPLSRARGLPPVWIMIACFLAGMLFAVGLLGLLGGLGSWD